MGGEWWQFEPTKGDALKQKWKLINSSKIDEYTHQYEGFIDVTVANPNVPKFFKIEDTATNLALETTADVGQWMRECSAKTVLNTHIQFLCDKGRGAFIPYSEMHSMPANEYIQEMCNRFPVGTDVVIKYQHSTSLTTNEYWGKISKNYAEKDMTVRVNITSCNKKPVHGDQCEHQPFPISTRLQRRDQIENVKDTGTMPPARRRLGWKPSHDFPRRREGFHHLFNRVILETT